LIGCPVKVVVWLTKPLASFLRVEAAAGAILLALTVAALVLSNSPWAHQFLTFWELPVGIQIGSLEPARSLRRAGRKFFPPHEQSGAKFRRVD